MRTNSRWWSLWSTRIFFSWAKRLSSWVRRISAFKKEYNIDQDQAEVDNGLYEKMVLVEEEVAHHHLHLH